MPDLLRRKGRGIIKSRLIAYNVLRGDADLEFCKNRILGALL